MLTVAATGELMCRPCAARLPALFAEASDEFLAWLWRGKGDWTGPPAFAAAPAPAELLYAEIHEARMAHLSASHGPLAEEDRFAKFKQGVRNMVSPNDVLAHCDLATAYKEMGLAADALREATVAFAPDVEHRFANWMFNMVFDPGTARPEAFLAVVARLRARR
ncbi:MAG TPA: hypothetical protein VLM85_11155 [Polyangiaceae bacterium]|nr:hypothetical protein [Polyangiaceae bacterium]